MGSIVKRKINLSKNNIHKNIDNYVSNKKLNIENIEKYLLAVEEFHRFAAMNKIKFLTYLLEMVCMETVNVKLQALSENQCAPANQKAPHC